ncbi:unnamed protein product [Prunus armeniaca]|uniref:Uncharacterized protein n=1 Tax=Prunus armeniaca TaxID=36596 RepID=A0A6J5VFI7_PRUAR|nr:unnamed protein product [Prunus armeniaca]CAB4316756.1 unnamed protein product [Prunus armeniaca]
MPTYLPTYLVPNRWATYFEHCCFNLLHSNLIILDHNNGLCTLPASNCSPSREAKLQLPYHTRKNGNGNSMNFVGIHWIEVLI